MIRINIVAVGKIKEDYFKRGIEEYVKRLKRFCDLKIIEIAEENYIKTPTEQEFEKILSKESEGILRNVRGKLHALCIEGERIDSKGFATLIKSHIDLGEELTFVIGGSYGLSQEVKNVASKKLSFSDLTFPHTMFRLLLSEQIYRAFMIINNNTYHK